MSRSRRLGIFKIPCDSIEKRPDETRAALATCIVVRAESLYHEDAIEYVAISEHFEEIPLGTRPPEYKCILRTEDKKPVFDCWQRI